MSKDTIIEFKTPEAERTDPLTDLLRTGAQQLIANAVEVELLGLLDTMQTVRTIMGVR